MYISYVISSSANLDVRGYAIWNNKCCSRIYCINIVTNACITATTGYIKSDVEFTRRYSLTVPVILAWLVVGYTAIALFGYKLSEMKTPKRVWPGKGIFYFHRFQFFRFQ